LQQHEPQQAHHLRFPKQLKQQSAQTDRLAAEFGAYRFSRVSLVFVRPGRGGILWLVVLIVVDVSIWQRALMQYSRNQNASALLTVKHDVLAMLQTTQARTNLVTESA
jgi:hypothetical protein